ncbi:MAG: WD40/YVTN/BNR-like repeat-containing protein, partial [Gemmatimonadales bacterium]
MSYQDFRRIARRFSTFACFTGLVAPIPQIHAQVRTDGPTIARVVSELQWREIGPAVTGGRIADIAVVETDPRIFYVGTASGGVWKTVNAGTTWEPVFD